MTSLHYFRNEVWRHGKVFGTHRQRVLLLLRGLPLGIALCAGTIALEKAFGVDWHNPRGLEKYKHAHGHGDHADEGHH